MKLIDQYITFVWCLDNHSKEENPHNAQKITIITSMVTACSDQYWKAIHGKLKFSIPISTPPQHLYSTVLSIDRIMKFGIYLGIMCNKRDWFFLSFRRTLRQRGEAIIRKKFRRTQKKTDNVILENQCFVRQCGLEWMTVLGSLSLMTILWW